MTICVTFGDTVRQVGPRHAALRRLSSDTCGFRGDGQARASTILGQCPNSGNVVCLHGEQLGVFSKWAVNRKDFR